MSNTEKQNPDGNAAGELPSRNDESVQQFASSDSREDPVVVLQQQLRECETKALRFQADLDNFRRRTRREVEDQLKFAVLPLMSELLDAVDNLNRALDAAGGDAGSQTLIDGVRMVSEQMSAILTHHGCRPIDPAGAKFDPNLHQAVQMIPSKEFPADHVVQVFRAGYQLHDRVIRPAQVVVSTGSPSQAHGDQ